MHHKPSPHWRGYSEASARTRSLRPAIGLDAERCEAARRLRRRDPDLPLATIATRLGPDVTEADVKLALATLRTRRGNPNRLTINVPPETGQFLAGEALDGEARWRTLDRLLAELAEHRRIAAGLTPGRS